MEFLERRSDMQGSQNSDERSLKHNVDSEMEGRTWRIFLELIFSTDQVGVLLNGLSVLSTLPTRVVLHRHVTQPVEQLSVCHIHDRPVRTWKFTLHVPSKGGSQITEPKVGIKLCEKTTLR